MKNKEIKLNITQFSEALGIPRSTLYRHIKDASIIRDENGMISLSRSENRRFLKENGIDIKRLSIPAPRPAGRRPASAPAPAPKVTDESRAELQRRHLLAKIAKLDLEQEIKRGNLLNVQNVKDSVFFYLDRVFSNLERLSNTHLDDIGDKIITNGGLSAEIRHEWVNLVLREIDTAKQETITRLNELAKGSNNSTQIFPTSGR
ncbi:MAG: hypothetical protein A2W19_11760 [Spirochaetes bacterium RBG_16_49_21]|nr:MAG: hypothetical protein A2W19_11760 [Spirochaetes bacterium RBG_16_49_21]